MGNICARCGEEIGYDEDWTDEDAKEEYQKNFPNDPNMKLVPLEVICEDCYQEFKEWLDDLTPEYRAMLDKEALEDAKNG